MTALKWSSGAVADLARLHAFLAPKNRRAATATLRNIRAEARKLLTHPRRGMVVGLIGTTEVRRVLIGKYELRYEIQLDAINVLRVFHEREDR